MLFTRRQIYVKEKCCNSIFMEVFDMIIFAISLFALQWVCTEAVLCQPANGYKIEIELQRAYDNCTTCERIDATSGFMNEAVGLLYIEHGIVPESCVILSPKTSAYCCKEKDKKSLKQVEITVNTLVICDPCEPLSQQRKRKEKTKSKTQKRKKGGIIIKDALPQELFVNSVAFDILKVKEKGKVELFCGYIPIGRQKLLQCDCPAQCSL